MTEEAATVTAVTRQRRKRKWDQPAETIMSAAMTVPGLLPFTSALAGVGGLHGMFPLMGVFPTISASGARSAVPHIATTTSMVQQSAAAIVQKINQDLASKVLLPQVKIQDELIAREIVINDAESGVRYKLTKRQTQEEIQLKTGAVVITRGRYRLPNGPVEAEKPLYLHISAGIHLKDTAERIKAVDQAAAMVEEMLKQGRQAQGNLGVVSPAPIATADGNPLTVCVYVGLEADPSSNLIGRIRGPNDQYINHIMNETGAGVSLKGRGSGSHESMSSEELLQPLHLHISSDSAKSVDDAKRLAENLLQTIRSDFSSRPPPYQSRPGPPANVLQASASFATPSSAPYPVSPFVLPGVSQGPYAGYYASGVHTSPHPSDQSLLPTVSSTLSLGELAPPSVDIAAHTAVNPYTGMLHSSKVYSAVPPPMHLLGSQLSENLSKEFETNGASGTHPTEKSSDDPSNSTCEIFPLSSVSPVLPSMSSSFFTNSVVNNPYLAYGQCSQAYSVSPGQFVPHPTVTASHASGSTVIPQAGPGYSNGQAYSGLLRVSPTSAPLSLPSVTSYTGYNGVYPQASPLQQVVQALQRPLVPVSVTPASAIPLPAAPIKAQTSYTQCEKHLGKQPQPRRKFQEFPVAAKESSGNEQLRRGIAPLDVSVTPPPGKSTPMTPERSVPSLPMKSMPPPPQRIMPLTSGRCMPPPPPKFTSHPPKFAPPPSSKSLSPPHLPSSSKAISKQDFEAARPPGTRMKLVEYGEEEEEESGDAAVQSIPILTPSFFNGKPFWAL